MFTKTEIEAAKKMKDRILKSDSNYCKAVYIAGEICMWDEINNILDKPKEKTEELYYIQAPGYVGNDLIWWCENRNGVTTNLRKAGKYNIKDAKIICAYKDGINKAWKVDYINSHISTRIDMQYVDNDGVMNW